MRTTLDIDPVVLSAARARAIASRISIGRALSELALEGIGVSKTPPGSRDGFPILTGDPAHRVTDELVAEYRDDP